VNDLLAPAGWSLLALIGSMTLLWGISLPLRNSSIVDIAWGPLFLIQALVYLAVTPDGFIGRKLLITALVAIWSLRLATHIARRNLGKGEDYRYATWRREAGGSWWWRSYGKVFLLQGLLAWVIGAPILAAQVSGPDHVTLLDATGALLWGIGFVFEAVGDWQLARFKADPANKGRTMQRGLWSLTRHPNYFGDATQWWGYYLVAAAAGGWWSIFGPAAMTWLIVRVSGVGLLEKTIAQRRPDYAEYMRTTSAFIPWFPRR
jgi:steroid 5-alpha reductase family enzyme